MHLIIACRSLHKGQQMKNLLEKSENVEVSIFKMDLGNIKSVVKCCEEISKKLVSAFK